MQSTINNLPPYLSLSIWLPILFGVIILAIGRDSRAGLVRVLALIGSIVSLLPTILVGWCLVGLGVGLVALAGAPSVLILFGLVDVAGAAWTVVSVVIQCVRLIQGIAESRRRPLTSWLA